jgi:hypothetical protein
VDWTVEGRAQYVTNTTQVANPAIAFAEGTECNLPPSPPPGGGHPWEGCFLTSSTSFPGGGDHDAYDLDVTRIDGTRYAFVATHPKNVPVSPEDFWIYNLDNNTNPVFVNKADLNSNGNVGLNALVVARDADTGAYYAFIGVDDKQNQFIVIDVTNPASLGPPIIINITGVGTDTVKDIKFYGGFAYLAIGNNIKVFNVTNPLLPVGPTNINLSGFVNQLGITEDYIYAATTANDAEIMRINRSDFGREQGFASPKQYRCC